MPKQRTKRGHGEGNVRVRVDGRIEARIMFAGKTYSKYTKTKAEARAWLREQKTAHDQGVFVEGRQTVAQWLGHWQSTMAAMVVKPRTAKRYYIDVRLRIIPKLGHLLLREVTPLVVQRFQQDLLDEGLSPQSVRHCRSVLGRAFTDAAAYGLAARNPVAPVRPPRVPQTAGITYTSATAPQVLAAFAGHHLEPLVTIALMTGLRLGELLGLRWTDVDLVRGTVAVRRTLRSDERDRTDEDPKTRRSRRTFALPPSAVRAFARQREQQEGLRRVAGAGWTEQGYCFTTQYGRPHAGSNVWKYFNRQLAAKGMESMKVHDLRKIAASVMAEAGVPLRVAMEMLGHSNIAMTADIYTQVATESTVQAAALIEAAFARDVCAHDGTSASEATGMLSR